MARGEQNVGTGYGVHGGQPRFSRRVSAVSTAERFEADLREKMGIRSKVPRMEFSEEVTWC